ncbi:MAG: amino acid permease [Bacteroidetes bacterium]|nr:amino acid permease [Bacteroidota bacterium]
MREVRTQRRLRKGLKLLDVFAIATGTTLSGGLFLLPGIAAAQAGPAMILAYVIAAVPLVPAMFSIVELGTAMPRAGGLYYFLDRTLGPVSGMIGGIGTWLALILKAGFALIGMGAYIKLFFPTLPMVPVAVIIALGLTALNIVGTEKSSRLQLYLVAFLLVVLTPFIAGSGMEIHLSHFSDFFGAGMTPLLATSGMVYVSYVGMIKVASLSEEVENPERNLPYGIFLALGTCLIVYLLATIVMVGVLPLNELSGDLTPVASVTNRVFGRIGTAIVSLAALASFISVANAGLMSASRYPLAMARDHLLPRTLYRLNRKGSPVVAILLTSALVIATLLLLDPGAIAKLASAFLLIILALVSLAVIVMRESHIESYDPGYRSPLYPWMQILGIVTSVLLVATMGLLSILFILGLIIIALAWYAYFAKGKIARTGAIYHVFERLGRQRYDGLDHELRGILKEKGLREEDPFDQIVARSMVIDLRERVYFHDVVDQVSGWLSRIVPHTPAELKKQIMEGTRIGATPVTHGVALPHLRVDGLEQAEMILVRGRKGIHICFNNPLTGKEEEEDVTATFFLVSPERDPGQHLRILAQIAGRVDDATFIPSWEAAATTEELKETLLRDERSLSVFVRRGEKTADMIGHALRDMEFPQGCLVTWLRRGDEVIVPSGGTILEESDRLTVIGDPQAIRQFRSRFLPASAQRRSRFHRE